MQHPEYDRVERPFIEQLTTMGWQHLQGAEPGAPAGDSALSGRESFAQVVYEDRFRDAVRRINIDESGSPWLSDHQLDWLLARLTGTEAGLNGNLEVTSLLRKGINARLMPGWQQGRPEYVDFVDWNQRRGAEGEGNDLLAVSQFRVDRGGSGPATPDLVLFVNGLPWVVVECKAPAPGALEAAVDQVTSRAGVTAAAPVPHFTRFAQLLVATDGEGALIGTVTSGSEHFAPWRATEPAPSDQVRAELGKPVGRTLTEQETLVAGVLRPSHLFTLIRDFTAQSSAGSRTVKVLGRYQQFRAVHAIADRLRGRQVADPEQRAGVVWHTQGSGKSLTMAFLVRYLRSTDDLPPYKVVVVTDRIDLEKQIRASLAATEEQVHRAAKVEQARAYLKVQVPDLVLVTLQKARRDDDADDGTEENLGDTAEDSHVHNQVANDSPNIVVLVDEAHRGNEAWQHARLRAMLPRAAMVGFTGTPIIDKNRKQTREIFGEYADTYTLRDAEVDGSVVPVRYEAHTVPLEVVEQAALDLRFDEQVPRDPEQRARVLGRFAQRKEILESTAVIEAKADHMFRHWSSTAMPDGFVAQVVAVSRKAAVRYREALLTARDRLLERIDGLAPEVLYDPMEAPDVEQEKLLRLRPYRDRLAAVDVGVVISDVKTGRPDPADWQRWQLKSRQDAMIERFKQGVGDEVTGPPGGQAWEASTHGGPPVHGPGTAPGEAWHCDEEEDVTPHTDPPSGERAGDPLAFLSVKSMLLTGFDAPAEQVMYLDRTISGVNLLQAIARTNRPYPHKKWGQIVDYVGMGSTLAKTLAMYDAEHLRQVYGYDNPGAGHLEDGYDGPQPQDGSPWLRTDAAADRLLGDLHTRIEEFLAAQGTRDVWSTQGREDLLAAVEDPALRGEFDELVRDFLTALNAVLPRPEALAYEKVAKCLGEVQYLIRRRYLDERDGFNPRRYGAKVRQLIAEHLRTSGVTERIPSVEISDADFMQRVGANPDPRARVSYMTGRTRLHISARIGGDQVRYERFSTRLEEIIRQMNDDAEAAAAALGKLIGDINAADAEVRTEGGLDPYTERPVHDLLLQARGEPEKQPQGLDLFQESRELSVEMAQLVASPAFEAGLGTALNRVRRTFRHRLKDRLGMEWSETGEPAGKLLELARERREDFLGYGRRHDS